MERDKQGNKLVPVMLGDPIQETTLKNALDVPTIAPLLTEDARKTYAKALQDLDCPKEDAQRSAEILRDQDPSHQVAVAYAARVAASNHNGNGISSKRPRK